MPAYDRDRQFAMTTHYKAIRCWPARHGLIFYRDISVCGVRLLLLAATRFWGTHSHTKFELMGQVLIISTANNKVLGHPFANEVCANGSGSYYTVYHFYMKPSHYIQSLFMKHGIETGSAGSIHNNVSVW